MLDRFLAGHGERLVGDPLKRALLQRDLWQLFDWSASPWRTDFAAQRAQLQNRLAVIIRRLALSASEIAALPDNYAQAEASGSMAGFPRGLFEREGAWLSIGAEGHEPTAATHTTDFGGRSIFLVMVRFPEGRQQAISYLEQLRDFEPAVIHPKPAREEPEVFGINPALPQFPAGTEWALVRRLCLIDEQGQIRPTPLIESVQVRRYVSVPLVSAAGVFDVESAIAAQRFAEFTMDRRHGAALKAIVAGERDFQFVHFRSQGADPFELTSHRQPRQDPTLTTCRVCHQAPGMLSVLSYSRHRFSTPPIRVLESSSVEQESAVALRWKRSRFEWGLLQGLWRQTLRSRADRPAPRKAGKHRRASADAFPRSLRAAPPCATRTWLSGARSSAAI